MTVDLKAPPLGAASIYNAAADHFDAKPLGFWDRHGDRAAALACLEPGERVLDVGCGTGSSALPAAEAVGPAGNVVAIDVARAMLDRARIKARERRLQNISFRLTDMASLDDPDVSYDAVISVFSVFFAKDMLAQMQAFWWLLRPGGRMVITVWARGAFEPGMSIFAQELHRLRPDLDPRVRPWTRLTDPDAFSRAVTEATGSVPSVVSMPDRQLLDSVADWWTILLGSGFRGEIEQLTPVDRQTLKDRMLYRIAGEGVRAIQTGALHAVVRKSPGARRGVRPLPAR